MPGHHIFSNACSRYVDRPRRSSGPLEGQSPVAQMGMLTGFVSFAQQGRRTSVSLACLRLQWRAGRQYSCSPEPTIACFLVKLSPCYADSFVGPTPSLLGTVWVQTHSHHAIRLSSRIGDEADSHSHGVGGPNPRRPETPQRIRAFTHVSGYLICIKSANCNWDSNRLNCYCRC